MFSAHIELILMTAVCNYQKEFTSCKILPTYNVYCQTGNLINMNDHSKSVWKPSLSALWHLNLCLKKHVSWLNVADGCYNTCFAFKKSVFTYFGNGCVGTFFMDFVSSVRVLDVTTMSATSSSFQILLISSLS